MGTRHLLICWLLLAAATTGVAPSAHAAELQPFLVTEPSATTADTPRTIAPPIRRSRARVHPPVSPEPRDEAGTTETRSAPRLRDRIVELALHLIDKPYRTGASGPRPKDGHVAFDCSGYVYFVLKTVLGDAFALPRMGAIDYRAALARRGGGRRCAETAPGDLVFFDRGHENYHIGIMTEASSGTFISATGSRRGVDYSSIYDLYWRNYRAECYRNVWLDEGAARTE